MIITLIKKIKVFVSVELDCNNLILFWLKGSITIWFWVLLRVNLLLNNTRYPPAELVGMLDSNGAMKESLSPNNIYVWFVIVPVPLITWMIKEKWVMKSVSLPVLLSQRHTCIRNEAGACILIVCLGTTYLVKTENFLLKVLRYNWKVVEIVQWNPKIVLKSAIDSWIVTKIS